MATVIAEAKKNEMEVIKTIRLSTWGAKLEASGGYNGNCDCTALGRSLKIRMARAKFAAARKPNAPNKSENCQDAADANDPENGSAVGGVRGVVVVTEQQNVVDGRADLSGRGVHQAQAHVAAGIFDAVEVAGDAAIRGQEQDAAGMGEQIGFRVVAKAEVRGARGGVNGFLGAGQEVPA